MWLADCLLNTQLQYSFAVVIIVQVHSFDSDLACVEMHFDIYSTDLEISCFDISSSDVNISVSLEVLKFEGLLLCS